MKHTTLMKRILFAIILGLAQLTMPVPSLAHGHGSTSVRTYARRNGTLIQSHRRATPHTAPYSPRRRAHRSRAARADFQRAHPCPSTGRTSGACPAYVVDHVRPLACGGADAPSNMAWQTTADVRAKDKWERVGCK
jgi:hypothetical protein